MKKHKYLVLIVYFTLILTSCEKKFDLTPLISSFESQSSEFEKIVQEILEYPEVHTIFFDRWKNGFSIRYQNNEAKTNAYPYPITIKVLETLSLHSVDIRHVLSTDADARPVETKVVENIKIDKNFFSISKGLFTSRSVKSGWVYLPITPNPAAILSSSQCHEKLLDQHTDVKKNLAEGPYVELYIPTSISGWYIYCSVLENFFD